MDSSADRNTACLIPPLSFSLTECLLLLQLLRSDEGAKYSAMDASADGNTAYLADKDGAVEVVDTRQSADAKPAAVRYIVEESRTMLIRLALGADLA